LRGEARAGLPGAAKPMLFPLSKSFTSTRLFQSGGQHGAPAINRTWTGSAPGAEERSLELHRLLTERKPFTEQLRLAKQRSEDLRRKDVEFSRAHKECINDVQRRLDEQAMENRGKTMDGIRDFKRRRADSEGVLSEKMRSQQESYSSQKKEMEERVKELPTLCGEPPAKEAADRREQRVGGRQVLKQQTRQYYEERRAFQDKLSDRPRSFSEGCLGQPKDEIIDERKAAGLAVLSKSARDYEAQLEGLYSKHHQRVKSERKQREEDFQAHLDHRLANADALATRRASLQERVKNEAAEREERLNSRPKGFAGYSPKAKSEQRMRKEAVLAKLAGTSIGGSAFRMS